MNNPKTPRDALVLQYEHFAAMYRIDRSSYNEGARDAADAMLARYDDAVSGDDNPFAAAPPPLAAAAEKGKP